MSQLAGKLRGAGVAMAGVVVLAIAILALVVATFATVNLTAVLILAGLLACATGIAGIGVGAVGTLAIMSRRAAQPTGRLDVAAARAVLENQATSIDRAAGVENLQFETLAVLPNSNNLDVVLSLYGDLTTGE